MASGRPFFSMKRRCARTTRTDSGNGPATGFSGIPDLTTRQLVEVDRAMIETYRIELIQMMENAELKFTDHNVNDQ